MPPQLGITGEVSIKPNPTGRALVPPVNMMIMGPTGSGKSTFIEALAGKGQSLGISKDQLAGFTQDVTAYEVVNTEILYNFCHSQPVWLIDTPGFSDSKISELEVIRKAKAWIVEQERGGVDCIIYLCPITDTRVPGSKRRTIEMLHLLFQISKGSAPCVTILTTMWDRLGSPQARERAEKHFTQLQNDIWKEVVSRGGSIMRFCNTQESALEVLKVSVENRYAAHHFPLHNTHPHTTDLYFPSLYQELLDRINKCQQEIELLQMEEVQLTTNPDPQLAAVVIPKLQEIKQDLAKFVEQLVNIGAPPEGFAHAAACVVSQYLLASHTEDAQEDDAKLSAAIECRLGELKVFDRYSGGKLVDSCWLDLHPEAKFIIFDNLVKLSKACQKEDRSHCLDPLRQAIALASLTDLSAWEICSRIDRLNVDTNKLRWELEHFNPPPPEFVKVQAQLIYWYLLADVNDAKGIVQIFQDALKQLHGQSDNVKECKSILKRLLATAKGALKESALALIEYGGPPEGYERVVFDYRELSIKGCVAQAKWIAKERLRMKS
ncbi:P-loop containing nucleoside triphosphate hydrolase protein [Panaeolus papilionaceus]|nr:P-loop containing nucleoside triphosphate hydrolase protein [Panaeolus papilionaceus]